MPLLASTQTQTANRVPLYVPMDGEGNAVVPNNLTVEGVLHADNFVSGATGTNQVRINGTGGFPSIEFLNGAAETLIGLQDSGTLLVGNNNVPVALTGTLNLPRIGNTSLQVASEYTNLSSATQQQRCTIDLAGFRFQWGFIKANLGANTIPFLKPFREILDPALGVPVITAFAQSFNQSGVVISADVVSTTRINMVVNATGIIPGSQTIMSWMAIGPVPLIESVPAGGTGDTGAGDDTGDTGGATGGTGGDTGGATGGAGL